MASLLIIREKLRNFYSRFENYVRPALKFLLAFITFTLINRGVGYARILTKLPVVLIMALLCSFFPTNFILILGVLVILLHLYALSLETVLVAAVIFFLMFLVYFRFSPKDTVLLLFTPICFALKIPYVIPICAGLICTPASVIAAGCGVVTWHMLRYISLNSAALTTQEDEAIFALEKLKILIDALMGNREMQVLVAAFAVAILFVYIIRRLPVDHCWTIAMITGTLIDIVVILVGDLRFETRISIAGLIVGSVIALLVAMVLKFFVFNVDYTRTEKVQFEDDEYYYYVKAVPKNTVSLADRKVKKIKGREKLPSPPAGHGRREEEGTDAPEYRVRRSVSQGDDRIKNMVSTSKAAVQKSNKSRTRRINLPEEEDKT